MRNLILSLSLLLFITACDEIMPVIPPPPPPGDRVVLLEDFSGGKCVPCSDAAKIVAEVSAQYGENFVPITIHTFTGGQADPYEGAKYDFRTEDGQGLIEFLGIPNGIPSGVVNRKLFEGEDDLQNPKSKWLSLVQSSLTDPVRLNMDVATTYESESRNLTIEASFVPLEDINSEIRIVVMVNESHLIDKQAVPGGDGVDPEFEHNHILRDVLTPVNGESLGNSFAAQQAVTNTISYTIPVDNQDWWKPENMEVVVFLVNSTNGTNEVMQARATHFAE